MAISEPRRFILKQYTIIGFTLLHLLIFFAVLAHILIVLNNDNYKVDDEYSTFFVSINIF